MSIVKKISENAGAMFSGEIISKVILFFITIYIARELGDVEFGKYSFAFAFTALFFFFADFGISQLTRRDVPKDKKLLQNYFSNGLFLKIIFSIVTIILIIISINLLSYPTDMKFIVYLATFYMISNSFAYFFMCIFAAQENLKYHSVILIIEKLALVFLLFIALIFKLGLIGVILSFVIASIIRTILGLFIIIIKYKPEIKLHPAMWKKLIIKSIPFGMIHLAALFYIKIDITMLSYMTSNAVVGWYSAAYNLILAIALLPNILSYATMATMIKLYEKSKTELKNAYSLLLKYSIIIGIPLSIGGYVLAEKIIFLLYSKAQYSNAVIALQILIFVVLFNFIKLPTITLLQSSNKEKITMWAVIIGSIVNIITNLFLIPTYGFRGAAIATLLTEAITVLIIQIYSYRMTNFPKIINTSIKATISALSMGIIITFMIKYSLLIIVPVGAIAYFITFILLQGFDKKDLSLFKESIK